MTATPTAPERGAPSGPSGYLLAALVLLLITPVALAAWVVASAALRLGARRWVVAVCGLVPGVVAAVFVAPKIGATASVAAAQVFSAAGTAAVPSWGLLGPLAGWFGRWAWLTAPLGIPAGMVAAAIPSPVGDVPAPEWDAKRRRVAGRAEARTRRRSLRRAEREGADLRSGALGVSLGGAVASWRIGDLIVPPAGQLGLAWLLVGAPGAGKTTAIERLAFLAGQQRRHLVVLDAKGGHDGLAAGVVAAYLASHPTAKVRLFPNERLDIWRGGPQAIVNRLVEVWDWSAESAYYREIAMTGLRLAMGQPGPPCQSSAELVRRLDPAALQRAWEHDPEILALVRSMAKDLPGVQVRVGNLVAALGGALDGEHSWEDADLWVVTVPAMVAPRDADAALRVLLSDYGHFTMARKGQRPSTLIVDEFSAIAGGRRSAIDLLERGRGAGAGVILAGQSAVALGSEEERARLLAAASAILLFRTPQPSELAALAGTERVAEGAWGFSGDLGADASAPSYDRVTVTMRARARVDQDQVRQLPTGEADLIVRGLAERVRIIKTNIPDSVRTVARGLTAPPIAGTLRPSTPGRAVASREVPGPVQPPQDPLAPPGRPPAGLDPAGPGRVRRYRPPGAGEVSPPGDRTGVALEGSAEDVRSST